MSGRAQHHVSQAVLNGAPAVAAPQPAPDTHPDAALLAMIPEFNRRKRAYDDDGEAEDDDLSEQVGSRMDRYAVSVLEMPPAQTAAGQAFKARAALHAWTYIADENEGAEEVAVSRFLREIASGGIVPAVYGARSDASRTTDELAARPAPTTHADAALLPLRLTNPDAELIAAADEFCRTMDRLDACFSSAAPGSAEEDAELEAQRAVLGEARAIAGRMAEMRATTRAGLAARAVALGRADPDHAFDYEARGTTTRLLLDPLLRDGTALASRELHPSAIGEAE